MIGHAARALPWLRLAVAVVVMGALLGAVRYDPWTLWPLQGTAVGLLAGAVGWCLDEPAAAVADCLPRGLRWQTTVRGGGAVALVGLWSVGVWWCRDSLFGHPWSVWCQGVAASAVTLAVVLAQRAAGEPVPGQRWALVTVPTATAWALLHPAGDVLPVFPYGVEGAGTWQASTIGWATAGTLGLVVAATVLGDLHWSVRRARPGRFPGLGRSPLEGPDHHLHGHHAEQDAQQDGPGQR